METSDKTTRFTEDFSFSIPMRDGNYSARLALDNKRHGFSLPMRDGNPDKTAQGFFGCHFGFSLPMRDGNHPTHPE